MTATQAGRSAAPVRPAAPSALSVPSHFLRRVARFIVLRAALRGQLSWLVALIVLARLDRAEVER